ncbi:GNAT family N-acetyltransferase [Sphingobium sp. SCG-1]|uniref:GNAT family N-acetyltransferase n=1 Tax=Sphingobium sp. SCG-1 TaxID=2072936 RepID=UPI001CB911A7|nr:GNAT family N-acetyltransferase [Sphingobium sp. SCG-1]
MQTRWEYRSFVEAQRHAADALDHMSQTSLFESFQWLEALHRHCMPESAADILHVEEGEARAWLYLAATVGRRRTAISNWYSFGFRPVFNGDPDVATRRRLVAAIMQRLAKRVSRINLYPVTADDGTLDLILNALRSTGWFAVARAMGINHFLDIKGRTFAEYWSGRPGAVRTLVKRRGRGDPFAFEVHHAVTDALWADYLSIYGKSWKAPEPHYAFLRELADAQGRAGTLRLGFARKDGIPVAVQLWTIDRNVALIHKLAHDAAFDAQSPGTLLSHYMFREAIDRDKVLRIDYGTGNNAYKLDWMESRRTLYRLDAWNPRFVSAWIPACRSYISGLVGRLFRR